MRFQQVAEDGCEIAGRRLARGRMLVLLRCQALVELVGGYVDAIPQLLVAEPHIRWHSVQPCAFDEFARYVGGRVCDDCDRHRALLRCWLHAVR